MALHGEFQRAAEIVPTMMEIILGGLKKTPDLHPAISRPFHRDIKLDFFEEGESHVEHTNDRTCGGDGPSDGPACGTACGPGTGSQTDEITLRPAKIITVGEAVSDTRTYPGRVQAAQRVSLAFRVAGPVVEVLVSKGQRVAAGAALARIDPRDYEVQVHESPGSARRGARATGPGRRGIPAGSRSV